MLRYIEILSSTVFVVYGALRFRILQQYGWKVLKFLLTSMRAQKCCGRLRWSPTLSRQNIAWSCEGNGRCI